MRHALVTGGGSGVGAATAQAFAAGGWAVTILGRRAAPLEAQGLPYATADVTDPAQLSAAIAGAEEARGPVAAVIANAGSAESRPFGATDSAHWEAMLAVNLMGVVHSFRAALPGMERAGWGRLIAVASTAGLKGYPYVTAYTAAKHAVVGLVRALALETAAKGITANALCPGFVETPMLARSIETITAKTGRSAEDAAASLRRANPQGRFIQPEEVADTALWLASDAAAGVNGHALSLSGGEI